MNNVCITPQSGIAYSVYDDSPCNDFYNDPYNDSYNNSSPHSEVFVLLTYIAGLFVCAIWGYGCINYTRHTNIDAERYFNEIAGFDDAYDVSGDAAPDCDGSGDDSDNSGRGSDSSGDDSNNSDSSDISGDDSNNSDSSDISGDDSNNSDSSDSSDSDDGCGSGGDSD